MSGWLERTVWLLVGGVLCVLIVSGLVWAVAQQLGFDIPIQTLLVGVTALLVWGALAGPTRPPQRREAHPRRTHTCETTRDCMEALTAASQLRAAGAISEREWLEIKAVHLPPPAQPRSGSHRSRRP